MISNNEIERFKTLDLQTIEGIADEKLRKQALKLKNKQGGFTLLELLVVVGILAIVAGVAMGALGGQEKRAASGAGANSIAAVEGLLKGYQASGTVLKDLDALESMSALTTTPTVLAAAAADASLLPATIIGSKLATEGKIKSVELDGAYIDALMAAGIAKVRMLVAEATDETTVACAGTATDGVLFPCDKKMSEIDIPGRMFDDPNGSSTVSKNRGRGFSVGLAAATKGVLPVWKSSSTCTEAVAGTVVSSGGVDNTKLGADKCAVLVALGFGNNVVIGASSKPQVNSAPAYGGMLGNQYNRYIALYNVGKGVHAFNYPSGAQAGTATDNKLKADAVAKLQAVVDTRGDFLDEELAEASGQKQ